MITIILAILFGAIGGFGIMGILSSQAYDKGYEDGHIEGMKAQFVAFVKKEEEE